jgi:hypothetical protein
MSIEMENKNLDIIQLIEQNPITRLTHNYQSKFIEKIQKNFTDTQQHLFVASFYCYLNYNKNDFVIDLDNVWKWLGFERKEFCKKVLTKNFMVDIDYQVALLQMEKRKNEGGFNKETIMLNINTFKKLCMKSKTKKADEIHDYFIKLEETFQEIINEESNELKLQLTENKQLLLENQIQNVKEKQETLIFSYHKKSIVYIFKIILNGKVYYKFGFSDNIKKRMNEHRRLMKCELYLVFCIESKGNIELENKLKQHFKKFPNEQYKRITLDINDYEYTEIIETNGDINNICSLLVEFNKNIGDNIETKKEILIEEKDILKLENENINLKIQYNEVQRQNYYIKELEEKLEKANDKIKELTDELAKLRFKPEINEQDNINQHFSNEIYEKFITENCELDTNFKCSTMDLLNSFKNSLQNTIYEAKVNSYYNKDKYNKSTNFVLPSYKKEFYEYFEQKLNYKVSAMKFRDKETQKSHNERGFFGIRLKQKNVQLYENIVYQDFINKNLIKDSYENTIKTTEIIEIFIEYLNKNNIKVLFKRGGSQPEYTRFLKEFFEYICNYFNIKEQRIKFIDFKSARPGFRYLKKVN